MPKVVLPIPETQDSVLRPIVVEVTKKLSALTGVPLDTRMLYPGDLDKGKQTGSAIGEEATFAKFAYDNQISIEVSEQYEEDRFLSTAVLAAENLHIFRDDKLDTHIRPVYTPSELTINYKFRATDKNTAIRWRDEIKTKTSMNREVFTFSLSYHYAIPPVFMHILEYIHSLRETVAPYGEDWDTYFKSNRSRRVRQISDLAGNNQLWCVGETQALIQGWFDFTGVPEEASRNDEAGGWVISFGFKLKYEKPTQCVMFYPLVVHNQLIGDEYRPSDDEQPAYNDSEVPMYATQSRLAFRHFEAMHDAYALSMRQGYSFPSFDEFVPGSIPKSTRRVYTALIGIDESNPLYLMNLNSDLEGMEFDPDILALLKSEHAYLNTPYQSIITVTLYNGFDAAKNTAITIDKDLNVYATSELSLREQHHLRVSILVDLSLLSKDTQARLRESGAALIKCLDVIDPTLSDRKLLPSIFGKDYIKDADLQKVINDQTSKILANNKTNVSSTASGDPNQHYGFNTVQSLFIDVYESE